MPVPIRLARLVEAMECPEDWECLLDPDTGEVITITDEERDYLEEDEAAIGELPEWQRDAVLKARAASESDKLLPLPSKFDVHEWDVMRRFATEQDEPMRSELLDAVHGTGAFRLFRITNDRLGLREEWFRFKDSALKEIARDWLRAHDLEFIEE